MNQQTPPAIPKWFLIVSIIALIWNILGLMAFISHVMMTPEMISELPSAEQALYQNMPMWATIAFATAVIAGSLGSALLLLKKSIAKPVFIVSLIGVLVQNYHSFFVIDSMAVYGSASIIMPLLVIVIGILLIALSNHAIAKGWLK
ncbi:hypothetical protein Q4489_14785 [Thalassotalea sp. 1_MG-2023]|uniref:hypothetical protein n=1 Tax=Thalassotalea sp. 1_MG-2023 TaxID=3062680 RepID=UPI0026E1514E|nr:hypothetical protein [Thalassotalea sp. 1_MG-2023]MDO6428284.1 hypothetical protein [Thalassotalea sp. 1_MG-2023]